MTGPNVAWQSAWRGPGWVLAGIVLGCAAFNVFFDWFLSVQSRPNDWLMAPLVGAWVFEPMLLAVWAALGPGRLIIRLPLVIPSLMILVSVPGLHKHGFQDMERYEFILITIIGMVILAASTALLLIFRGISGWRIEQHSEELKSNGTRLQFGTKYLIALITLCAIALGITTNLVFQPPEPPPFLFGPEFVVNMAVIGSATMSLLLLPVIAVPLLVLNRRPSKRFVYWAFALWAVVTTVSTAIWTLLEGDSPLLLALTLQLGAVILGASVALLLRLAGYRLNRYLKPPRPVTTSGQ